MIERDYPTAAAPRSFPMHAETPVESTRKVDRGEFAPGCPMHAGADGGLPGPGLRHRPGAAARHRTPGRPASGCEAPTRLKGKMRMPVLYRDGAEHREHRRQTAKYFTPRRVDSAYRGTDEPSRRRTVRDAAAPRRSRPVRAVFPARGRGCRRGDRADRGTRQHGQAAGPVLRQRRHRRDAAHSEGLVGAAPQQLRDGRVLLARRAAQRGGAPPAAAGRPDLAPDRRGLHQAARSSASA